MKRLFEETDNRIPHLLWEIYPQKQKQLKQIMKLDYQFDDLWNNYSRFDFMSNCENAIKPKILRIFIRHMFSPATKTERGFYSVTIEGRLLDEKYIDYPFGLFFENIKVLLEKKFASYLNYEWQRSEHDEGKNCWSFRFKIYLDKNVAVKISLQRSNYGSKRYEMSPALREILPNIRQDPTEEDVLMAMWQFINYHNLMESRDRIDKPFVKCNSVLSKVLENIDYCSFQNLRKRIVENHLLPVKPMQIDYTLMNNVIQEVDEQRYTRIVDIDVEVDDECGNDAIALLTKGGEQYSKFSSELEEIHTRSLYLTKTMNSLTREMTANNEILPLLNSLPDCFESNDYVDYLSDSLRNIHKRSGDGPFSGKVLALPIITDCVPGFLDVRNDSLFQTEVFEKLTGHYSTQSVNK